MKLNQTIGLIGVGNMGGAILEGLLSKKIVTAGQIWIYDKVTEKAAEFKSRLKVNVAASSAELVKQAGIILLAVKPQDLAETAQQLTGPGRGLAPSKRGQAPTWPHHPPLLISILAGTPIVKIRNTFGPGPEIVRAMPNLGAKVGESLTALTSSSPKALAAAETIFSGCGKTLRLEEKHFDLITALSGSGPAYFFYLMELLAKEGREHGLSADEAKLVAVQTAVGAALLAASSTEDPSILRERVTSKGGTTEAALQELIKTWPPSVRDAIQAAQDRGRELGK